MLLALTPSASHAVNIPAGYDYMLTGSADVKLDLGGGGAVQVNLISFPYENALARALWGKPSYVDPAVASFRTTWYDQHGSVVNPPDPEAHHAVSQVTTTTGGHFDTVIRRLDPANMAGVGSEDQVGIQIDWLSLKSSAPVNISGYEFDIYVGVNSALTKETGAMRLRSGTVSGDRGWINLGTGNPGDTLGLPLNWVAQIMFHDTETLFKQLTGHDTFINHWVDPPDDTVPTYEVPEPSSVLAGACLLGLLLLHLRRRDLACR